MPRPLDDYVEVAERVEKFFEKYPEGALEPYPPHDGWKLVQAEGWEAPKDGEKQVMQTFIVFTAAAYRHDHDPHPGIGTAWEIFPGRTNFTRGSEMQNAETSAWGRALAALGIETKRGIASREEVRNRQAERDDGLPANRDGSLSRSRTTDAQKNAAGVMTDPQQRAHNKLRRDGEPDPQRVEKLSTTPDDDPFYDNGHPAPVRTKPAGWLLSERFAALGVFDRKERLDQCAEIVGRPISSSKELEPGEIAAILEALQRRELAPDAH